MPRVIALALALSGLATTLGAQPARFLVADTVPSARWLKGNTHTHTSNSDGDTAPQVDRLVLSAHPR
jgi:hypothetical protein